MLKIFNDPALHTVSGDVFGRIYEYFLMKFAIEGAQDKGEFFTPVSLVQTIVNVIEPDHGVVFDPACGSGGMFVQTSHFLERTGRDVHKLVTFRGQEKTATTIRLAKMNLAVHGLEGNILEGNTFYQDHHEMLGKADFVMANPPFNVDGVDAEKVKNDARLPFGLPGVNNKKEVSNGNYLWISYFYSYLNRTGRAGFVMSSQASSAGHGEKEVRRKLVETGHVDVDVLISIRSNFFYTRTVPCELWFFDKGKPAAMRDKVLMVDARNIYRKVTRKIYDFTPEQLNNLSAIVWLYRGMTGRFLSLVGYYLERTGQECDAIPERLAPFTEAVLQLRDHLQGFLESSANDGEAEPEKRRQIGAAFAELDEACELFNDDALTLFAETAAFRRAHLKRFPDNIEAQHKAAQAFDPIAEKIKGLLKQTDLLYKLATRAAELAMQYRDREGASENANGKRNNGNESGAWDSRAVNRLKKELDPQRREAVEQLKQAVYFHRQAHWLLSRFPEAGLRDVEGLVKLVDRAEIEANDWSLTPGRYVGVAPAEVDEEFDFEETLRGIHLELAGLNEEAAELAKTIRRNFEELM